MLKRAYFLRLFPIFLIWMAIGLFSLILTPYMYKNCGESIVMDLFVVVQLLLWLCLGYFLKKIYIYTYKDELTNLWNRKYLYTRLDDEIKKMNKNKVISLAIIDIDNFKCVNDNYGHLFGDKVLKELAQILQNNLRKSDIIARWGGEEMMAVLPKADAEGAIKVFDRVRVRIEQYDFGCRITVSGGIATINEVIEPDKLIEMADKALYKAKRRKNRIAVYEEDWEDILGQGEKAIREVTLL